MSAVGHLRQFGCAPGMSALPPIATESLRRVNRRKGPGSDMRTDLHLISEQTNPLELLDHYSGA